MLHLQWKLGKNTDILSIRKTTEREGVFEMKQYECDLCGYVYDEAAGDPDNGVAPGTKWEDLPADWVCPLCGAAKDEFSPK